MRTRSCLQLQTPPTQLPYNGCILKSLLAERSRDDLTAQLRGMTAEQRLHAFLAHCQLVMALNHAGQTLAPGALHAGSRHAR
jgi:hypothetical protein